MSDRSRSRSPEPNRDNGGSGGGDGGSDEVKLYLGNLDYATDADRIRDEFGRYGEIKDVFLPTDHATGRPRGFGFVTYARRSDAQEAITKLDNTELDGRTINVNESRPKGSRPPGGARGPGGNGGGFNASNREIVKLYVGNLSYDTDEARLKEHFGTFGEVTDCFMPTHRETGRPRGFAFVSMKAAEAEEACTKSNGMELDGRTLRVNEAQPKEASRRGGGHDDRGGRGGYGGGQDDRGGYGGGGGYGGRGGYEEKGGYDDRRGGYDDRSGYGGGYGGGGGGYDDRRGGHGGGYEDRGRGGYDDRRGGGDSYGGRGGGGGGGYDDRGRY